MLEEKDVNNQEVITPEGVEPASPAEEPQETQEPETGTPNEPVTQETPETEQQVPYERFKTVNDEKNYWRQQAETLAQHPTPQPVQPQQQAQPQDKYAHLSAEEQVFYRNQEKMVKGVVDGALAKQKVEYDKRINNLQGVVYNSQAKSFLKEHPDIKPNTPEAMDVIQKMQRGLTMDEAYWAVKGPAGVQVAKQKAQTEVKQKMQVKKKANVEQTGVSSAGMPSEARSFREDLEAEDFET